MADDCASDRASLRVTAPSTHYARIAAAVTNADKNPRKTYVVEVASGTYANDFVEVTRPMTIAAAGPGPVVLDATQTIPNEKGIIYATANLTVKGLTFRGARIADNRGGNGAGIRDQNINPKTAASFTDPGDPAPRPPRQGGGREIGSHARGLGCRNFLQHRS